MEWVRGETIGMGSFGKVSLAIPIPTTENPIPTPFVVKSSEISHSSSLNNETQVLSELANKNNHHHHNIIQCLGHSLSYENGKQFYNLFLEYACNGSLADRLRNIGGKFNFFDVKRFTKSILEGLCYIHQNGFVHCDIKLQNILLFSNGVAKIADFGLAKRVEEKRGCHLRGTPLYMSPEIVAVGDVGPAADIWALGCAVVEMISGMPAWKCSPESDVSGLLYRIGVAGECPGVPESLGYDGMDFVGKCFVKDPNERWTARMLLDHPFVTTCCCGDDQDQDRPSPRCPFEFPHWEFSDLTGSGLDTSKLIGSLNCVGVLKESEMTCWSSVSGRFEQLLAGGRVGPDWCDIGDWITVR